MIARADVPRCEHDPGKIRNLAGVLRLGLRLEPELDQLRDRLCAGQVLALRPGIDCRLQLGTKAKSLWLRGQRVLNELPDGFRPRQITRDPFI